MRRNRRFQRNQAAPAETPDTATSDVVQRYNRSEKRWQKIDAATGDVIATKRSTGPYQGIPKA